MGRPISPDVLNGAKPFDGAGRLHGYCRGCDAQVWDVLTKGQLPRYGNPVICWHCGLSNARRPFPGYQVWWARKTLRRAHRRVRARLGL